MRRDTVVVSQRRLISSLAVATALALSACGSDDAPTADSAVPLPVSTTAPADVTEPTEPPAATIPVAGTAPTAPSVAPPPTTDETTDENTEENTVPTDPAHVDIAVADLADRLDVDPAEIDVVSVDEVTWSDGSLGCPEPGMAYTQALVDGIRILLSVDGVEYEYHSGGSGDPFYCPAERVTPPATGSPDI